VSFRRLFGVPGAEPPSSLRFAPPKPFVIEFNALVSFDSAFFSAVFGPNTPRQFLAPQRHSCLLSSENGLFQLAMYRDYEEEETYAKL